jgi:excisionase family DNA binding protein
LNPVNCAVQELREENLIMKDYFSVNELAGHFRVNPKTIYRRLWAKDLPAYKVGRSWRVAKKDIKWLKQ